MSALFRMDKGIPYAKVENAGRIAVESILTVTVGVLLGRLAWVVLAPSDAASQSFDLATVQASDPQSGTEPQPALLLTQLNPFAADALVASPTGPAIETSLDLKLSGVRSVTGNATASSAVISFPDGVQKRFVPGDEVLPGVVLVNVTSDTIHLSRNGALETLSIYPGRGRPFEPSQSASGSSGDMVQAASTAQPQVNVTPAALASDTVLTPEFRDGEISGYRLEPRGAGAFEAAGLQAGDLILRINGQAIEGQRPDEIYQSVSSGSDVSLDVVRQGAIVRLRVAPAASLSQ